MTRILPLLLALLLSTAQVRAQACGAPAALDDGWTVASAAEAGLDGDLLCEIGAYLSRTRTNVHSVVVVRHGKLVFERYFDGYDDPWGAPEGQYKYDATTKHDMRSVSKSAVSLLVGIAIDRKLIAGESEPVAKFFPDYAAILAPAWAQVTLGDLLTMSSGMQWDEALPWNDPRNDEPHLGKDADPLM
jgi:CubicO group peptidase (beta-lactamase class C family)